MADDQTPFEVAPGAAARVGQEVRSPEVPPGVTFDEIDRAIFDHICMKLKQEGIVHNTVGIAIVVIVRTFRDWLKAQERCEKEGRVQISPRTGWASPTPWAEDEKNRKMELGQWLPKACLTIPSHIRVKKDSGASGVQDDLFGDLVAHGQNSAGPGLPH